jgi:serine/threonine protein kinase
VKSKPPEHWWVKIGDFGISKRAEDGVAVSSTLKGTLGFMAPELHGFAEAGKEPSSNNAQAADMWSLGELAFQMLTKEPTFRNMGRLFSYVQDPQSFPSAPLHAHSVSLSGLDFITSTMTPAPEKRPTAEIALQHHWMEPYRSSSLRPPSIASIGY